MVKHQKSTFRKWRATGLSLQARGRYPSRMRFRTGPRLLTVVLVMVLRLRLTARYVKTVAVEGELSAVINDCVASSFAGGKK